MRSKIGIVYETASGQIRRIIVPGEHPGVSEDQQLAAHVNVNADEKLIIEHHPGPIDIDAINAIVQLRTGRMRA